MRVAVAIAALLLATGCAHVSPEARAAEMQATAPPAQVPAPVAEAQPDDAAEAGLRGKLRRVGRGIASWYGSAFHGKATASGEPYDMNAFTAAHPWLPFGTLVEVTSLVNGRTVMVRINDRGPFSGKRVIDLSRAAAQSLGLVGRGVKPVELRVAETPGQAQAQAQAGKPDAESPAPR